MEENLTEKQEEGLPGQILSAFHQILPGLETYSPLTLAYLGDNVYELVIRTHLVAEGNRAVHKLNREGSFWAKAGTQAAMYRLVQKELTAGEEEMVKRGRNAKSGSVAKNASVQDYRMATGWECLLGHLYLSGKMDRVVFLIHLGMQYITEESDGN